MTSILTDRDIEDYGVKQLKTELKMRCLPVTGKKQELKKRLWAYLHNTADETSESNLVSNTNDVFAPSEFDQFMKDYLEFKTHVLESLICVNERMNENDQNDRITELENENRILKEQLQNKQVTIDSLFNQLELIKRPNVISNGWQKVPNNNKTIHPKPSYANVLSLHNRFEQLEQQPCMEVLTTDKVVKSKNPVKKVTNDSLSRNGFVIDNKPENNVNINLRLQHTDTRTPGKKENKIVIFGDSMVKRIKGFQIARSLRQGKVFVKSFPGATCNDLKHYVVPTLEQECPDTVVIHIGTNNIRPRSNNVVSTPEQIATEIIEIGKNCKRVGVSNIIISAITCRKNQIDNDKVRVVNEQVRNLCVEENFSYISNNSITQSHIWEDGIHLTDEGTNFLALNFINSLNRNLH